MGRNSGVILQWTFLGAKVSRHYKGHSGVIKKWTLDAGDIAISPIFNYIHGEIVILPAKFLTIVEITS